MVERAEGRREPRLPESGRGTEARSHPPVFPRISTEYSGQSVARRARRCARWRAGVPSPPRCRGRAAGRYSCASGAAGREGNGRQGHRCADGAGIPQSFRVLPWSPATSAGCCQVTSPTGGRCIRDPRNLYKTVLDKLAKRGYDFVAGLEVSATSQTRRSRARRRMPASPGNRHP